MTNFTTKEKDLIVEMVEERLASLEVDIPDDLQQRSRRLVHLLRIVSKLFPDEPNHPALARLVIDYNILARRIPAAPATAIEENHQEAIGPSAVVSDDDEEVPNEETGETETEEERTPEAEATKVTSPLEHSWWPWALDTAKAKMGGASTNRPTDVVMI